MPLTRLIVTAAVFTLLPAASLRAAEPAAGFRIVEPDHIVWQPIPDSFGAQSAVIAGDPSKPGAYVIRVHFPPHVMDRPHWHSGDRHVTVIEGVWYAGTGATFDPAAATPLKPGSYMFHPANGVHWDGASGDEGATVQIIGYGPVTSTNVDPKAPGWVQLPR